MPRVPKPCPHKGWYPTNAGGVQGHKLCPVTDGPAEATRAHQIYPGLLDLARQDPTRPAPAGAGIRHDAFLDVKQTEAEPATYRHYVAKLKPFLERFGHRPLRSLTEQDGLVFKKWVLAERNWTRGGKRPGQKSQTIKGVGPTTCNHFLRAAQTLLNWPAGRGPLGQRFRRLRTRFVRLGRIQEERNGEKLALYSTQILGRGACRGARVRQGNRIGPDGRQAVPGDESVPGGRRPRPPLPGGFHLGRVGPRAAALRRDQAGDGVDSLARREYHRAIALFSEAIRLDPSQPAFYHRHGDASLEVGDFVNSGADFARPDPGSSHQGIGSVAGVDGRRAGHGAAQDLRFALAERLAPVQRGRASGGWASTSWRWGWIALGVRLPTLPPWPPIREPPLFLRKLSCRSLPNSAGGAGWPWPPC